ncbi:GlxA family transcriptional regulator [Phycicoccus avicenniae]|uniref:GlxA family transcriptional regulator n=1 Tax=Phycicoccus avicenniae TaxID=2828860 RepID=UPI003D28D658
MALRTVAVLLQEPVALFEYGVLAEVFGIDRTEEGLPPFDYRVCSEEDRPLDARHGTTVTAAHRLDATYDADLVAVPASPAAQTPSPAVVAALRDAHERGAWVMSVCSGAFTLAAAGILDGRSCTTHWMHAAELAAMAPAASVDPDVLYVRDGNVITSAGTAAGIDAALHLVRTELGAAVAATISRRMVVPPHRDGGQRQFVERPVPTCEADSLGPLLQWMVQHLDESFTVDDLAARAAMSPRTFARRFVAETGTTPHQWVTDQRVLRARHLLEESDLSIEEVARDAGFGSAALLRHHFSRCTGITPTAFRAQHRVTA